MDLLVAIVFGSLLLLRGVLVLALAAALVKPTPTCPACFAPTVPVLRRWLARLGPRWLECRWCPRCSWQGLARKDQALSTTMSSRSAGR